MSDYYPEKNDHITNKFEQNIPIILALLGSIAKF